MQPTIAYITHNEIDREKYDACIASAINSKIYAYSWYLDITSPGWGAMVLGDYEGVFPLTCKKKIFWYLYQPFFTQQLGFFYTQNAHAIYWKKLLKKIPDKFRFIDIYLNESLEAVSARGFSFIVRKNYILDLDKHITDLRKHYSDHTSRNIRKAKKELQSIKPCDIQVVISQYKKNKGEDTKELQRQHYDLLEKLMEEIDSRGMLETVAAYDPRNSILSSAAFIITPHRIYYMIGSANEEGRDKRSMYLLFDTLIKKYSESPIILDFEGSEKPGIARFFKGFGAVLRHYKHLRANRLPFYVRWLKKK
jgi:lipid II:glycine glycyltransferase (peptidoglycan interpeptide bridge formation enzyme)